MATTTQQGILTTNEFSQELIDAIDDCVTSFQKTGEAVTRAIEIGKRCGISPRLVGDRIRAKLLQAGFHRSTVARYLPPEAKHMENSFTDSVKDSETGTRRILQRPTEPADYQSEDLQKYSKQFLIEIIRYLEQKHTIKHIAKQVKDSIGEPIPKHISKPIAKPVTTLAVTGKSPYSRIPINKTPSEKAKQVIQLRNEGKSTREIERLTGVSKSSVMRILSK